MVIYTLHHKPYSLANPSYQWKKPLEIPLTPLEKIVLKQPQKILDTETFSVSMRVE